MNTNSTNPLYRADDMRSRGFTFWQDGEMWLSYLDNHPNYMTQGTSLDDLKEHLLDLYRDLSAGAESGGEPKSNEACRDTAKRTPHSAKAHRGNRNRFLSG